MYRLMMSIRIGGVITAVILCGVFFMGTGRPVPGTGAVIQIDFSQHPQEFAGLPVEIDGEAAGRLEPNGGIHRAGFNVGPGRHVIRVVHRNYESRPLIVAVQRGMPIVLILDYQEVLGNDGRIRPLVAFQN